MDEQAAKLKQNADDRLKALEKRLDDYEAELGIPTSFAQTADEIEGYLNLSVQELKALTSEECWEISVVLSQFAFYLQRKSNIEQSRFNYIEEEINRSCCTLLGSYDKYDKYETKLYKIARENSYVARLMELKTTFKMRIDRLYFLSASVKNSADLISRSAKAKNERERYN